MSRSYARWPSDRRRMDLARLGVDEIRLDLVAVAPEQRVRERAVAPVDAGPVEVDQERRHRVEQPVAVRPRAEREAHEQAAVLDREGEVLGGEDGLVAAGPGRQADRRDRRQARCLEPAQDVELRRGDVDRLLLERDRPVVGDEEPDEVARRADRQLAEGQGLGPLGERQLPRAGRAGSRCCRAGAGSGSRSRVSVVRASFGGTRSRSSRSRATRTGAAPRGGGGRRSAR